MATEVRGGIVEALVATPVDGQAVTGGIAEALVATPIDGQATTGGLVEALVATPLDGIGVTGGIVELLVVPPAPEAVVPDTGGSVGAPTTFDGNASTDDEIYWNWVSVPGGSAIVDNPPEPLPDNNAATPVDMTDNEGLYHFEGNANDTSGLGNNGTVTGATQVAGQVGSFAYNFSGTNQYINVLDSASIRLGPSFTIAFWIRPNLVGDAFQRIVDKATGGFAAGGYAVYLNTTGELRLAMNGSDAVNTATGAFTAGVWQHVAVVNDGSKAVIYKNGLPIAENLGVFVPGNSAAPLRIGAASWTTLRDFNGDMDELALWSRPLSFNEVFDIYQRQIGIAGSGQTFQFIPDVVGTYTIQATAFLAESVTGFTDVTTADAVVILQKDKLVGWRAEQRTGLVGRFAQVRAPKQED